MSAYELTNWLSLAKKIKDNEGLSWVDAQEESKKRLKVGKYKQLSTQPRVQPRAQPRAQVLPSQVKIPLIKKPTAKIPIATKSPAQMTVKQKPEKSNLPETCPLIPYEYHPKFYDNQKSQTIFNYLSTLNYDYTYYFMFGKVVKSPRRMIWFADDPAWTYHFSNNHINGLPVHKFTPELMKIRSEIEKFTGQPFNALLINEYNPTDSISWHSDDDPWLGQNFIVPSLSFGAERTFKLRLKKDKAHQLEIKLGNGSLIIMKDKCQELWEHSIPKQSKVPGVRYNLTFRYIHPKLVPKQFKGKKMAIPAT